jgi:ribosomal protein S6
VSIQLKKSYICYFLATLSLISQIQVLKPEQNELLNHNVKSIMKQGTKIKNKKTWGLKYLKARLLKKRKDN